MKAEKVRNTGKRKNYGPVLILLTLQITIGYSVIFFIVLLYYILYRCNYIIKKAIKYKQSPWFAS